MNHVRMVLIVGLVAVAGCRIEKNPDGSFGLVFRNKPTPAQSGIQALSAEDADRRREGIVNLSRSPRGGEPQFVEVYAVVAGNIDEEPTVRAAAVDALARAGAHEHVGRVVLCLNDESDDLRIAAARALGAVRGDEALEPLTRRAQTDPNAFVRARSAESLRHYLQPAALETLLLCLDDPDFGVRYAARESLRAMTGEDAGYDPAAWRQALQGRADPFGGAAAPESPERPWWRLW